MEAINSVIKQSVNSPSGIEERLKFQESKDTVGDIPKFLPVLGSFRTKVSEEILKLHEEQCLASARCVVNETDLSKENLEKDVLQFRVKRSPWCVS